MYFVNNIGLNVKVNAPKSFSTENNHQRVPNVESQNTILLNKLFNVLCKENNATNNNYIYIY